jgi:hypothetical protein
MIGLQPSFNHWSLRHWHQTSKPPLNLPQSWIHHLTLCIRLTGVTGAVDPASCGLGRIRFGLLWHLMAISKHEESKHEESKLAWRRKDSFEPQWLTISHLPCQDAPLPSHPRNRPACMPRNRHHPRTKAHTGCPRRDLSFL